MRERRERGEGLNASVYWDFENMLLHKTYAEPHLKTMQRVFRWIAGVLDVPVTRVEAVEFTRYARTPQAHYQSGRCDWHMRMRQLGAVVHRAWPRMTDAADVVLLDRIREALDDMQNGGPERIITLMSGDKGFDPMLEAAQSEGVTVIRISGEEYARYYPGGLNFSIPIQIPMWNTIRRDLLNRQDDCLRPPEEWKPWQGPHKWYNGTVALEPAQEEEKDLRVLHNFLNLRSFDPKYALFDGSYVREGLRLNDTLLASLRRAMARTGMVGTRTGKLRPEVYEAVERDVADLSLGLEDEAAVFWNFEDLRLMPQGPTQKEMLGRMVRWFEGLLGMPVRRVEVSRFVEPWERLGAYAHDWLYNMQSLGMVVNRVWPPRAETTNMALTRGVAALAKAAEVRQAAEEKGIEAEGPPPPRLVCVFSNDLYFDDAMRAAQLAGISALWIGPEKRGIYYPANSAVTVRIDLLPWDTAVKELAMSMRNPFTPGASTPDAPAPVHLPPAVPADPKWGRPDELGLESARLRVSPEDLQRLSPGVGIGA